MRVAKMEQIRKPNKRVRIKIKANQFLSLTLTKLEISLMLTKLAKRLKMTNLSLIMANLTLKVMSESLLR